MTSSKSPRIQGVDALRGLVMILMALDHVRDYFHSGAMLFQPDDLSRTTAALFFTRWITHVCAPTFAFLAGVGAFVWLSRGRTVEQLSNFLWKRGLWLVLLELTVVRFAMFFSLDSGPVLLLVFWTLGWSMVALAGLVRLPPVVVATLSAAVILLHNLTDPVRAASLGKAGWVWKILHEPGAIDVFGVMVITAYPLLVWIAVMAAGFCFGRVAMLEAASRRSVLLRTGLALTLAFVILRLLNVYGDPQPWSAQSTWALTVMSFLRTTKYPPSLEFLLMTLGPAMLLWAALDRVRMSRNNPLIVFGRVPLFYFVVHLFVIHFLTIPFALVRYGTAAFLANPMPSMGGSSGAYPAGFGYTLPTVYAVWLLVVVLMYVPCLYFSQLKERRHEWWLRYL